jgi:hypothetical protein
MSIKNLSIKEAVEFARKGYRIRFTGKAEATDGEWICLQSAFPHKFYTVTNNAYVYLSSKHVLEDKWEVELWDWNKAYEKAKQGVRVYRKSWATIRYLYILNREFWLNLDGGTDTQAKLSVDDLDADDWMWLDEDEEQNNDRTRSD